MDVKTRTAFCLEMGDLMKKYDVSISSSGDVYDNCIQVCTVVKEGGRWPRIELIFMCDEFTEDSGKELVEFFERQESRYTNE